MKKCNITRLFPSVEKLKERLYINMETLEVTDLKTGKILIQCTTSNRARARTPYKRVLFKHKSKVFYLRLSRLVFYYNYEYLPKIVDHIDRNSLNNKLENLRELSHGENARNSEKHRTSSNGIPSSRHKGVSWNKKLKKWSAYFRINNRKKHLGYFTNEDDAGQAVNDKIKELGLEKICVLNDTPQERAKQNNQFDPLPEEMGHIRVLFQDIEPLVDLK